MDISSRTGACPRRGGGTGWRFTGRRGFCVWRVWGPCFGTRYRGGTRPTRRRGGKTRGERGRGGGRARRGGGGAGGEPMSSGADAGAALEMIQGIYESHL